MGNHPAPGIEPVSAALVGGFLTTAPPGKSYLGAYYVAGTEALRTLTAMIVSSLKIRTKSDILLYPKYLVHCSQLFNDLNETDLQKKNFL